MFFFAYGAQCSYLIIIGDTLSVVIEHWGDYSEDARDTIRPLAIVITSVVLVLPLSLIKDMARLGRTSFLSLLAVGWIVVIVVVRSLTGVTEDLQPTGSDEDIPVISKNFFPSIGIIAFAFVCHHSCFLVFNSLQNNTQTRWKRTTRTSLSVSLTACLLLAVAGYLTFRGRTEGDLLVNFSKTDQLMNVTRALFAVTMVLTYPMEIFVRHVAVLCLRLRRLRLRRLVACLLLLVFLVRRRRCPGTPCTPCCTRGSKSPTCNTS